MALEVYGYAVAQDGSVQDHLAQFAQVRPELADPDSAALRALLLRDARRFRPASTP